MERLRRTLKRIDGKGYKAYKDIQGTYHFPDFTLHLDYIQGDPFASPSRIRVRMGQEQAEYRTDWFEKHPRKIAIEDFVARQLAAVIQNVHSPVRGTGKSGMIAVDRPGQEILKRTTVVVTDAYVEGRISIGLPARGRKILGRQAETLLLEVIPAIVRKSLPSSVLDVIRLEQHLALTDNQQAIRAYLKKHDLMAFVANGALLPRESGVSNRPLQGKHVVRFQSPPSLEQEIEVPHGAPLRGMALSKGVHLIVGGGYHGKSTLLKGIERGVYDHIAEDGREYVITDRSAVKIRAEDGRRVEKVNISPFINNLPFNQRTDRFSTDDASGSTSQAAGIMETLEIGSRCLLIDEDTSATNFMIRDGRMQRLVSKEREPITPFLDRVRQLLEEHDVSTVLVLGGSGDYLDVADTVIRMDEYVPYDVTKQARQIVEELAQTRQTESGASFGHVTERAMLPSGFDARRGKKEKVDAKGLHHIIYGRTDVDLSALEQLVDASQTRAIAQMMRVLAKWSDGRTPFNEILDRLFAKIYEEGLDSVSPFAGSHPGDLALPRKIEMAGAVNRLRTLRVQ